MSSTSTSGDADDAVGADDDRGEEADPDDGIDEGDAMARGWVSIRARAAFGAAFSGGD